MATQPQTSTGADPFAGAPGDSNPAPAAPTSAGAMPTFTGGGGSSKTLGGVPVSQFPATLTLPGTPASVGPNDVGSPEMGTPSTVPAYQDGDQWAPASDPNPDTIRSLQMQMIEGGLLTMKQVHLGIWDQRSADAYAKVLAQANLQGVSATQALDHYVTSEAQLPTKQLSPDDLKGIAQQTAQQFLGRNLTDAEIAQFSTAFQSAFAADAPTTAAGTGQLAQDLVTKEHPKEAAATNLHLVSQHAVQILTSPNYSTPTAPN